MKRVQVMTVLLLFLLSFTTAAQNKFPNAIERSGDAGRIIATLALVPETGLPSGLFDKAVAVGVFPRVKKETLMFTSVSQGYGVISSRVDDGWTMPAFYEFSGGGYGNPFAQTDTFGIIFFFMSKEAMIAFEKGGVPLKGDNKALAGPLEPLTDEQRTQMESAEILAYAYFNGKLKGTAFGTKFWKSFLLNPDNKINTPLYGIKGREVLSGKKVDRVSLPAGILAYQEALLKYFGQVRRSAESVKR